MARGLRGRGGLRMKKSPTDRLASGPSGMGGIDGGNCTGEASAPWSSAPPVHGAARWTGALAGTAVGCGTLIGCLHPGQGTVFPNAGSVTLRVLLQ